MNPFERPPAPTQPAPRLALSLRMTPAEAAALDAHLTVTGEGVSAFLRRLIAADIERVARDA